jgi:pyruvate dehydrogenase E2 component (dihydrolipoamide acetyltransferase)
MARFEFKLPDIGEGVTEGEIVAWHVKEGDQVGEDQVMVEVMTDKATVTIGAPKTGKIEELCATVGSTVKVGDVLVVIHTGNGSRALGGHPSKMPAGPTASAVGDIQESLPGTNYFAEKRAHVAATREPSEHESQMRPPVLDAAAAKAALPSSHFADKPLATPATRKLARDLGMDLRAVPPTGEGGRVTKQDVRAASSAGQITAAGTHTAARGVPRSREDHRIAFVGMRRKIAERMQTSKNTAAHFTFVEECDASRVVELRARLQPEAKARGVELTFMPFMIKAVCAALVKHPMLNASLDVEKNEIVQHGRCNIGIAAATDQGLVVPVIHDADQLGLYDLAREVKRLGEAARDNKLQVSDLSGSTFTITSLGKQAGLFAVPIVNFPNVGILGVHRIKERPVVKNGQIAIGQVMLLSLSLDHRIVDGHVGAAFAYDVIAHLEEPALMFIGE